MMPLTLNIETPLTNDYCPEINISKKLSESKASYYQLFIDVLQWIVELGRSDIYVKVYMISLQFALPHDIHIKEVLHTFAYLKLHTNSELVFDQSENTLDKS